MTILEIKTAIAGLLDLENGIVDFTVGGQDLCLVALNHVRRQAELSHDFEFQRQLVTVSVNGVTGGSLESAVLYGTSTQASIKSIIDMGLFDSENNLVPTEWTTVSESLERQRIENPRVRPRYPTDSWYENMPRGQGRFNLTGSTLYRWPKDSENNFTVGLEVYTFSSDWTATGDMLTVTGGTGVTGVNTTYYPYGVFSANSTLPPKRLWISRPQNTFSAGTAYAIWQGYQTFYLTTLADFASSSFSNYHAFAQPTVEVPSGDASSRAGTFTGTASISSSSSDSTSDIWTTHAAEYLVWGSVVYLNHLFKQFVYRQEGNLQPPEKMRDNALEAFKDWDAARYEQNRRHGR